MTKYQQYAELKSQIKDLQFQAKELEGEIFGEISDMDGSKLETEYATFSVMYRPKWKYSTELSNKEEQLKLKLKQMKKQEEADGTAEQVSGGGILRCQIKDSK